MNRFQMRFVQYDSGHNVVFHGTTIDPLRFDASLGMTTDESARIDCTCQDAEVVSGHARSAEV